VDILRLFLHISFAWEQFLLEHTQTLHIYTSVLLPGVCKLECPFLDVTASIFLHPDGLEYVSCQKNSFNKKGLIYMIFIQFIVIQNENNFK
jgi:hypothetical protein